MNMDTPELEMMMSISETATNSSIPRPAPELTTSVVIRSCTLIVMSLASAFGNIWTIRNIQKSRVAKKLQNQNYTAIYSLITHLSVADLLVTLFCMVGDAIWGLTVQFLAGDIM